MLEIPQTIFPETPACSFASMAEMPTSLRSVEPMPYFAQAMRSEASAG
jgi:hypothetical protein